MGACGPYSSILIMSDAATGGNLHGVMVSWLWEQGVPKLWLKTDPATRAERFYESAGWSLVGPASSGHLLFERRDRRDLMPLPPAGPL